MKISGLILLMWSLVAYSIEPHYFGHELEVQIENTFFGMDLFKELSSEEGNLLFSPLSAHSVLSMIYSGSSNETAKEMRSALRLIRLVNPTSGTKDYGVFLNGVMKSPHHGVSLHLANGVFADKSRKLKKSFRDFSKTNFLADAEELDFKHEAEKSRNTINKWVEKQTMNKIHDLVQKGDVTADTLSVLVNAMYFRGNWSTAFPKGNTRRQTFRLNSKSSQEVDMMSLTTDVNYAKYPDYEMLSLNYQGNDVSMVIMLPTDVDGLPKVEAAVPTLNWNDIQNQMADRIKMTVALPKFKLESSMDLVPHLKKMGMKRAFDPELAEFPELSDYPTFISKVLQKTFIEVDETGTEAAAATSVNQFVAVSQMIYPEFTADHPFLFFIWHKAWDTVLFIGRYSQP